MNSAVKKLIRHVVPKQLLQILWPWGGVPWRELRRNGCYVGNDNQLFPGFIIEQLDTYVDVGCGTGDDCMFAARCGAEVIGIDINEGQIADLAKRLRKSAARQHRAIVSECNPLPIEDETATRVVCREVLEHVPDPKQFMGELVRIGQPGARYLLAVPDPASEAIMKKVANPAYWLPPNHVRVFQRDEFARLIIDSGLTIEKRSGYSSFWTMWWTMFWPAAQNIPFGSAPTPVLHHLNMLWSHMIADPRYAKVLDVLDETLPKSQVIVAVKE